MSEIRVLNRNDDPATPPSGKATLYVKDGEPFVKLDNGTIVSFQSVFGQNKTVQKKVALETTGGSEATYDTLNLSFLPTGKYRVGIRYVWNHSSGANDFIGDCRLDGNSLWEIHQQEPKDGGTDQRNPFYAFTEVDLSGNHAITINYESSNTNTARIYESEIEVWRVE